MFIDPRYMEQLVWLFLVCWLIVLSVVKNRGGKSKTFGPQVCPFYILLQVDCILTSRINEPEHKKKLLLKKEKKRICKFFLLSDVFLHENIFQELLQRLILQLLVQKPPFNVFWKKKSNIEIFIFFGKKRVQTTYIYIKNQKTSMYKKKRVQTTGSTIKIIPNQKNKQNIFFRWNFDLRERQILSRHRDQKTQRYFVCFFDLELF